MTTTLPTLTPAQTRAAKILAKSAYLRSPYVPARTHDWRDAERAAKDYLANHCGCDSHEAHELGRELAGEVVREIETASADQTF